MKEEEDEIEQESEDDEVEYQNISHNLTNAILFGDSILLYFCK